MTSDALAAYLAASPSLAASLPGLARAAVAEAPLLILGAPGSGRSSLARALHAASRRGERSLVEIDPAAIPATLFESELFGHATGAFTGADRAQPGRLLAADGGSLLLDPVDELPLAVQPKLLRLLAEKRFAPLGGRERALDARLIAVGPDDLAARAAAGRFREDLFFRLEVLRFRLPALAERRDDLRPLASALVADLAARAGRPAPELSPRAWAWMAEHSWPGNVRELRNVLERALVLAGDGPLDPPPPAERRGERPRPLRDLERDEIRRALAWSRGHQGEAAAALGISRKALWAKRRRLGIP